MLDMDVRSEHVVGGMVSGVYLKILFVRSRGMGIVIRCDRRQQVHPRMLGM